MDSAIAAGRAGAPLVHARLEIESRRITCLQAGGTRSLLTLRAPQAANGARVISPQSSLLPGAQCLLSAARSLKCSRTVYHSPFDPSARSEMR